MKFFRENDLFLTKYLSAVIVSFEIYVNLTLKCEHVSRLKKLLTGEKRKIF